MKPFKTQTVLSLLVFVVMLALPIQAFHALPAPQEVYIKGGYGFDPALALDGYPRYTLNIGVDNLVVGYGWNNWVYNSDEVHLLNNSVKTNRTSYIQNTYSVDYIPFRFDSDAREIRIFVLGRTGQTDIKRIDGGTDIVVNSVENRTVFGIGAQIFNHPYTNNKKEGTYLSAALLNTTIKDAVGGQPDQNFVRVALGAGAKVPFAEAGVEALVNSLIPNSTMPLVEFGAHISLNFSF
ncbi:MAG: hypothetical protein AB7F28_04420 [Candidatus Margulisiibacteriota bacterium]